MFLVKFEVSYFYLEKLFRKVRRRNIVEADLGQRKTWINELEWFYKHRLVALTDDFNAVLLANLNLLTKLFAFLKFDNTCVVKWSIDVSCWSVEDCAGVLALTLACWNLRDSSLHYVILKNVFHDALCAKLERILIFSEVFEEWSYIKV